MIERFRLVAPGMEHKQLVEEYIGEYFGYAKAFDPIPLTDATIMSSSISELFRHAGDYEAWLRKVVENQTKTTNQPIALFLMRRFSEAVRKTDEDKKLNPEFEYIDSEEELVGVVSIDPETNDAAWHQTGNVIYNIRPTMRGNGYGKIALFLALCKCDEFKMNFALLVCPETASATQSAICAFEGKLIRRKNFLEHMMCFYIIDVEGMILKYETEYAKQIAEWPI